MGKGLPGGRRQAGRIDYRTEPRRSVVGLSPQHADRPRGPSSRAANPTGYTGYGTLFACLLYPVPDAGFCLFP